MPSVFIKWGDSNFAGQPGDSDSQPVSMFSYLKNLPLKIQTWFNKIRKFNNIILLIKCFDFKAIN